MWTRLVLLASRLRGILSRRRLEEESRREIEAHLELLIEEYVRRGMSLVEATREARLRCGGAAQLQEELRELRRVPLLESCLQDLRYGMRVLRQRPGFAAPSALTLALGIRANNTAFTIVNDPPGASRRESRSHREARQPGRHRPAGERVLPGLAIGKIRLVGEGRAVGFLPGSRRILA